MLVMPMLFFLRVDAGPPTQWSLSPESESSRIDTKLVAEIWATSWEEGREAWQLGQEQLGGRGKQEAEESGLERLNGGVCLSCP